MKKITPFFSALCVIVAFVAVAKFSAARLSRFSPEKNTERAAEEAREMREAAESLNVPSEMFWLQRSYPDATPDLRAYTQALGWLRKDASRRRTTSGFNAAWRTEGPGNTGARFNCIKPHPTDPNIIYAGAASGGVWKTTDGGATWLSIFDAQSYLAIGDIALDPNNPNTVYVGTGDANISGYVYIGDGVWKSTDGGATWQNIGLTDQRIVSRIVIDPTNSNVIYAATMGNPFVKNTQRGLYKSTNGGATWSQMLYVADQAGIIDLVMNPQNPQTLYAASFDRYRTNSMGIASGINAKVWKTTDGGANWTTLAGGLPAGNLSRIGLAISQQDTAKVFASYCDSAFKFTGVWRTADAGTSWVQIADTTGVLKGVYNNFGWYFGQIRVNPTNDNELYVMGVDMYRTLDGGQSWSLASPIWWTYEVHADKHDLVFYDGGKILLATDGGMYRSEDGTATWQDIENIPTNQIYRVATNPHQPNMYYCGVQDNGSNGGNASTINSWMKFWGGDGFQMRFDDKNADIFYCETQNANLFYTTDGGQNFLLHTNGINPTDIMPWDALFTLSHVSSDTQFFCTNFLYKNTDSFGGLWKAISPDLTDIPTGINNRPAFHFISAFSESRFAPSQVLYVGTSDANVWVTQNGGANWTNITGTLPERFVTCIEASPTSSGTVFVSHSGYRVNDNTPHLHKSTDYGATWNSIQGDMPNVAVNHLAAYPYDEDVLFAATDGGVYATLNGGAHWERLGSNMPVVPVYDLDFDKVNRRLIAGTYGRSMMTFPLDSIVTASVSADKPLAAAQLHIFPNPTTDDISVALPAGESEATVVIFNAWGSAVKRIAHRSGERIPLGDLPKGAYIVQARTRKGLRSERVVVE